MKLKSILSASLLAITAAVSAGVQAASDTNAPAVAQTPTTGTQGSNDMKPNSHMEEKSSAQQKAPEAKVEKLDPTKDKRRHLHPRDGK